MRRKQEGELNKQRIKIEIMPAWKWLLTYERKKVGKMVS